MIILKDDKNHILIHSDIRTQFQPKGKAKELQEFIISHLKRLSGFDQTHLQANLITNDNDFYDVENIVSYNIGSGSFGHLNLDSFGIKKIIVKKDKPYIYEYEYRTSQFAGSDIRNLNNAVIENFEFKIEKISSDAKAIKYWLAYKNGKTKKIKEYYSGTFGMRIEIQTPKRILNLSSVIKQLIDGIICGFQYQTGIDEELINCLSEQLNEKPKVISRYLNDKDNSIMGKNEIIRKRGKGIILNPIDDLCIDIYIFQRHTDCNTNCKIKGEVFAIE